MIFVTNATLYIDENMSMTEEQKKKRRAYHKKWREINKRRLKSKQRRYYQENRDKILAYTREYKHKNHERWKEYEREYMKKWRARNPHYVCPKQKMREMKRDERREQKIKRKYIEARTNNSL